MITYTRFPFWFWGMKEANGVTVSNNNIIKDGKEFTLQPAPKILFLTAKYFIVFIVFSILFNKYDFSIASNKLVEYFISLLVAFVIILIFKDAESKKRYTFLIAPCIMIVFVCVGMFYDTNSIAYIIKYLFLFYAGFQIFLDLQKRHFYMYNSKNKLIANVLIG
jgi:hypothetical protein